MKKFIKCIVNLCLISIASVAIVLTAAFLPGWLWDFITNNFERVILLTVFMLLLLFLYHELRGMPVFPFRYTGKYYELSDSIPNQLGITIKKSQINYNFIKRKRKRDNKKANNILKAALSEAFFRYNRKFSEISISSEIPVFLTNDDINSLLLQNPKTVNMYNLKTLAFSLEQYTLLENKILEFIPPKQENMHFIGYNPRSPNVYTIYLTNFREIVCSKEPLYEINNPFETSGCIYLKYYCDDLGYQHYVQIDEDEYLELKKDLFNHRIKNSIYK